MKAWPGRSQRSCRPWAPSKPNGRRWYRNVEARWANASTPWPTQTDAAGLLYLTVGVLRERNGALALSGYPAFVGAPASAPAQNLVEGFRDVDESSLAEVVERALRNYLDDAGSELAADLTESAEVSLPTLPLTLDGVQELKWLPGGGSVFAVLAASDRRGARYTLAYELDVVRAAGRWEISAIQTNPYR